MNDIKYPKLKIISEQNRGVEFILKKKRYTCGRKELNDIVFDDSSVSSNHCELLKNESTYIISDTGSTNGTTVNDVLIDKMELKNNDIVKVGSVELLYDGEKSEVSDKKSVQRASAGLEFDSQDHDASLIYKMKNISPFAGKSNSNSRLYQTAITTIIVLLGLVVLGLLVWLFSTFYYQ